VGANSPSCGTTSTDAASVQQPARPWSWLVPAAHANEGSIAVDTPLISLLESDDNSASNLARLEISNYRTPPQWSGVGASWDVAHSTFNADGGRLYAWLKAIARSRTNVPSIARSLDETRLSYLANLMGHNNYQTRRNAMDMMSWLMQSTGWPQGVPEQSEVLAKVMLAALDLSNVPPEKLAPGYEIQKRQYNALVAIGDAGCHMDAGLRQKLLPILERLRLPPPGVNGVSNIQTRASIAHATLLGCAG
jgi:hypothetical protein